VNDADSATFRSLEIQGYGADKDHVIHNRRVLKDSDAASFRFLKDKFTLDKNQAYFDGCVIVEADPDTFEVLKYPYARDSKNIFCCCLRMNVESPEDFKVLKPDVGGSGMHFVRAKEDLTRAYGDDFSDRPVLFEENQKSEQYIIKVEKIGRATDGKWIYSGPKRKQLISNTK